jgi:hypothetical protein
MWFRFWDTTFFYFGKIWSTCRQYEIPHPEWRINKYTIIKICTCVLVYTFCAIKVTWYNTKKIINVAIQNLGQHVTLSSPFSPTKSAYISPHYIPNLIFHSISALPGKGLKHIISFEIALLATRHRSAGNFRKLPVDWTCLSYSKSTYTHYSYISPS